MGILLHSVGGEKQDQIRDISEPTEYISEAIFFDNSIAIPDELTRRMDTSHVHFSITSLTLYILYRTGMWNPGICNARSLTHRTTAKHMEVKGNWKLYSIFCSTPSRLGDPISRLAFLLFVEILGPS